MTGDRPERQQDRSLFSLTDAEREVQGRRRFPGGDVAGEGGRLVFAGLANLLPGAGLPPPGGGALFPLVRRRPVGAHLASAAWAVSFRRVSVESPRREPGQLRARFVLSLRALFLQSDGSGWVMGVAKSQTVRI